MATSIRSRTFTPKEIERIVGLTPKQQRDWRWRGHLPKKEGKGWTRANVAQVARMWLTKILGERGLALRAAEIAAEHALPYVLHRMLSLPGAVDVVSENEEGLVLIEAKPSPKRDKAHMLEFICTAGSATKRPDWTVLKTQFVDVLLEGLPASADRTIRYLILASEGDNKVDIFSHIVPAASLLELPDNLAIMTVVDHFRLAEILVARMESPLVEVCFGAAEAD